MARQFANSLDVINFGSSLLGSTTARTIATWVYISAATNNAYLYVKNQNTVGIVSMWFMLMSNRALQWRVGTSSVNMTITSNTGVVPLDTWTHVAVTWNGLVGAASGDAHIYVNGLEVSYSSVANGSGTVNATNGTNTFVGGHNSANTQIIGALGWYGIWQIAFDAQRISNLASGSNPLRATHAQQVCIAPLYGVDSPEPNFAYNNVGAGSANGALTGTTQWASTNPPVTDFWDMPKASLITVVTPVVSVQNIERTYPRGMQRGMQRGVA